MKPLPPDQQNQAVTVMKSLPLFSGCSDAQLLAVARRMQQQSFGKTKVILMEQEISRTLYILVQGSVGIWRRTKAEKVGLATLKAPDFFGEGSMFSEAPANALVKAQEECLTFTLARRDFDELAGANATFGLLIEKNMQEIETRRPSLQRPASESEEPQN